MVRSKHTARKCALAPGSPVHFNLEQQESYSDGKHAGYLSKKLIEILSALGYHDQPLYTSTPVPLRGDTYAWRCRSLSTRRPR
jgi:hypothetical protein